MVSNPPTFTIPSPLAQPSKTVIVEASYNHVPRVLPCRSLFGLLAVFFFLVTSAIQAQPTRLLNDEFGRGEPREARLVFFLEEGELCAALSLDRGPTFLRPKGLMFRRAGRGVPKASKGKLEIRLELQETARKERNTFRGCVPTGARVQEESQDEIQVTVRASGTSGTRRFFLPFPMEGQIALLRLDQDPTGAINGTWSVSPAPQNSTSPRTPTE